MTPHPWVVRRLRVNVGRPSPEPRDGRSFG